MCLRVKNGGPLCCLYWSSTFKAVPSDTEPLSCWGSTEVPWSGNVLWRSPSKAMSLTPIHAPCILLLLTRILFYASLVIGNLESEANSPYVLPYAWGTAPTHPSYHNIRSWPVCRHQEPNPGCNYTKHGTWKHFSNCIHCLKAIKEPKGRNAGSLKTTAYRQWRQHLCLNFSAD